MRGQAGFFDLDERLQELSAKGDTLERLNGLVDLEMLRLNLARAVPRSHGAKGGRPPFDHVFLFKVLVLQASHSLSDERHLADHGLRSRIHRKKPKGLAPLLWLFVGLCEGGRKVSAFCGLER